MYLAYKKIKKHRAQKAAQAALQSTELDASNPNARVDTPSGPVDLVDPVDPVVAAQKDVPTPEEIAEKKRRRIYRWKLIAGLFGPFALQALDTTIIASALSDIATEFRAFSSLVFFLWCQPANTL